jgi:hypothetical protein
MAFYKSTDPGLTESRHFKDTFEPGTVEKQRYEYGKRGKILMEEIKAKAKQREREKQKEERKRSLAVEAELRRKEKVNTMIQQQKQIEVHQRAVSNKKAEWDNWRAQKEADKARKKRGDEMVEQLRAEADERKRKEEEHKNYLKEHQRLSTLEKQLEDRLEILQRTKRWVNV